MAAFDAWTPPGDMHDATGTHFVAKGLPSDAGSPVEREIVVCSHGIKLYHSCYNPLAAYLLEHAPDKFVVIQWDQMGRGFSRPSPNGKYTDAEYLPALLSFLTFLRDSYLPSKGNLLFSIPSLSPI